jgi:ubiquinone/menaquinone biosynthesis C-methylase UbiE
VVTGNKYSEPYADFAAIYDEIMCGVDYEAWADYVEQLFGHYSRKPRCLIDLACGTGSSTLPFARRGYQVSGVDLSEAMLEQALMKARQNGLTLNYFKQDLCTLELPEKYDCALLFQDGLNYLLSEADLKRAFRQINAVLNRDSLFIFDLTRPRLRPAAEKGSIEWADLEDFTLIWESCYCNEEGLWSVQLTVFKKTGNGLYHKFQEKHQEKEHDPDLVINILNETGFTLLDLYPSFSLEQSKGSEAKLTFVVEKC